MYRETTRSRNPKTPGVKPSPFNYLSLALMAGIFILGIGVGVAFSSTATFTPENVASLEFIDRSAPNAEMCVQYGASATVMDTRLFVTFKPFSVYVSQPRMQPGCVLRTNNWAVLEQRNLVSSDQVRDCKNRMNTFGFTGNLDGTPQINCVYQNDIAGNMYLNQPGMGTGTAARDSERF